MLAIDEAMVRLQQIQAGLSVSEIHVIQDGAIVTEAVDIPVRRAYAYFPARTQKITETPCFINQWTAPFSELRSVLITGEFQVRMQLLVRQAGSETDRAAAVASAFFPKLLQALAQNVKLNAWGPATVRRLRGADPTLTSLEFAGESFVGLDLFLDIYLNAAQVMEA